MIAFEIFSRKLGSKMALFNMHIFLTMKHVLNLNFYEEWIGFINHPSDLNNSRTEMIPA